MQYILHFNGKVPKYTNYCIKAINTVDPDSKIYFVTDDNYKNKDFETVNTNDVSSDYISRLQKINYFKEESNPLWNTSLIRIFYLYNAAKLLKIDEFVHFDTDVLIYKPFNVLKKFFEIGKFNITATNENFLTFGYSYVNGLSNYKKVCDKAYEIMENAPFFEEKYYKNQRLNEMVVLNIAFIENPELFNLLDTIPNKDKDIIFDAISYGQYLGGVDKKIFSKKTINPSHYSGRAMLNEGFRPKIKSTIPFISYKNKKIELANLHLHKKNLAKFMPRI